MDDDDDEFGDLYTDVLRPLSAQYQESAAAGKASALSQGRPIDLNINSDDEEILFGVPHMKNPNSNSALVWNLNAPVQEKNLAEPRGFDLNLGFNSEAASIDGLAGHGGGGLGFGAKVLEKGEGLKIPLKASGGSNFVDDVDDDDDINILLEDGENKDGDLVEKEDTFRKKEDDMYITAAQKENTLNKSVDDETGLEQMIPGLSERLENPRGSNFKDEWESEESEDDLQIVLNDNSHGPMAIERMTGVIDEDAEPLVIVADNGDVGPHHQQAQMIMEEPVWGGEGGPEADGEKDLGDAAKTSGGGGSVASAAMQPKVAYNNQLYHHPFHSQFKYVRPGAVPLPAAGPGGIPGQVRPPVSVGPPAGRGRGDWRPAGIKGASAMQKGFYPGYGMPAWAANTAGRGYGSGLDFTLPSHKTIFEVDIDNFEDKPWKLPGIDVSDFFNFGLNEDSWRGYCKQLEQCRLETTMQSKIRVHESGRMEQDYDPGLPQELALAVGIQDIPSENANPGIADADLTDPATGSAHGRPSLPVGRPIPVEISSGDRLPSVDTRRPRFHDTDAIIEIICHISTDGDDIAEREDKDPAGNDLGGGETDDFHEDDKEDTNSFSPAHNGQKMEAESRRAQLKNTVSCNEIVREDVLEFSPGVSSHYHPDREIGLPHEERSTKGRGHVRLLTKTASDSKGGEHITDDQNEESIHSEDGKPGPTSSSSHTIGSDRKQALVVGNEMNDGFVMDDRSIDTGREEMAVDATTKYNREYGNLIKYSTKEQKINSHAEQLSQHDDDDDDDDDDGGGGEDSKAARCSENRKSRSRSSKNHRRLPDDFEDEVHQYRHPPSVIKKQVGDDDNYVARRKGRNERNETGRRNMAAKGREDSLSRSDGDANLSLHWHGKSESEDHGRRFRVEDPRKREHGGKFGSRNRGKFRESESEKDEHHQSRNQLDNGSRRGATNCDHDVVGSRQRDRKSNLGSQNEKVGDLHGKSRKEEAHKSREYAEKEDIFHNNRESSSRRKRDREDGSDQLKRDEQTRLQDDDLHYARQKEGGSFQRERSERQRERDEWYRNKQDEVSSRRERGGTRPVMRIERAVADKTWISHSRGKDNYKGSGREYNPKDVAWHGDQFKRRDRVENASFSEHGGHEDTYARGNQLGNDDKKARYETPSSRAGRVAYGSVTSRVMEHKRKEGSRKNRESVSGDHTSLNPSQRNHSEHGGQISEMVNLRGRTAHKSGEVHVNNQSNRKLRQEKASSGDEQPESRKGRSKLECWMSHKERDFDITSMLPSSSRDVEALASNRPSLASKQPPEESSKKAENKPQPSVDEKDTGSEINNVNPEVVEDTHLDTVEKLKKRSERFKLPMPSEKDALAIKKLESEPLPLAQTEIHPDLEIKSERPARKRRWTGN